VAELTACKSENNYKEYSTRNYSTFEINKFIRLVENKVEQNDGLDVSERMMKFENSILYGRYST